MRIASIGAAIALAFTLSSCSHQTSSSTAPVDTKLVRPVPTPFRWESNDRSRLRTAVDAEFASLGKSVKNGFVILAADGTPLYNRNGSLPRTPASTLKVLTAATALAIFGPTHRFTTRIDAVHPVVDHILHDDLWLVGGGDPVFSSDDLRSGIAALYSSGLRRIDGRAMVDASAFLGPAQNPRWASDDLNLDYAAGTSALSLDGDIAIFSVQPTTYGSAARVRLLPGNASARIVGNIITGGSSSVRIDHTEGSNSFTLGGTIAQGEEQRFPIPMGDVPHFVGGVMDAMLHARGIASSAPSDAGYAPLGAHALWTHQSQPLIEIAHHMLVVSDNHIAEQLLRMLGTSVHKSGTEASGIAVERAFLAKLGVKDTTMSIYDGSGLAPANRIAPSTLAAVLADASTRTGSPLILGLPRVGMEGTVARHVLHAAAGRVRAKSGHIRGVDGLVGIVQTRHHGPVAFAFLANDADDGTVEDAEDRVFDIISMY